MELYLLTNLEKKKKPCMSGCLDFCLFLESTVFRGFYSASENGRTKILQPVRERMGMLEIHLASLLKPCKGGKGSGEYSFAVPYEGLSRLPQHCGSWKPEGKSSHARSGSAPGIPTQPWLMSCVFYVVPIRIGHFGKESNTCNSYEGVSTACFHLYY